MEGYKFSYYMCVPGNKSLSIFFAEAKTLKNYAYLKPSFLSTKHAVSLRSLPGVTCLSTKYAKDSWWQVDLLWQIEVRYLNIMGYESQYLQNFEIRIGNTFEKGGETNPSCGTVSDLADVKNITVQCSPARIGRFASIIQRTMNYLRLCEVMVYGIPGDVQCTFTFSLTELMINHKRPLK